MLRKLVLLAAAAAVVAATKTAAPVSSADQAWDGGGCHADLFPQDAGCALRGHLFQDTKASRFKGRFNAEVQQVGTMEADVSCGHAVRACGKILACRCPKP